MGKHFYVLNSPASCPALKVSAAAETCQISTSRVHALENVMAREAAEGEEQLSLYDDWLEYHPQPAAALRVFLSPNGRQPKTSSAKWRVLSFLNLASIFRQAAGLQDKPGYHFLRYYLTGVLRDVCGLPVPISSDCENPYAAVDYLQSVLGATKTEDDDGQPREMPAVLSEVPRRDGTAVRSG
jgi:hypothetical protein